MLQERVSLHVVLCAAGDGSYRASKSDRAIVVTGRNPGIRFRSEVPDDAAAGEKIVLAALARIHIQLRHARPELSSFTAQAEVPEDPHIESQTTLQYTGSGSGFARVWAPKHERGTFTEVPESAPKTDPRRNCLTGKDVQPCGGSPGNPLNPESYSALMETGADAEGIQRRVFNVVYGFSDLFPIAIDNSFA